MMSYRKFDVQIEADGFRITARAEGLVPGVALLAEYELSTGWDGLEVRFEPEPRTFFHPFRRSMFVYTGQRPLRVVVRLRDQVRFKRRDVEIDALWDVRRFYEEGYFECYPAIEHESWNHQMPPSWSPDGFWSEDVSEGDGSWDAPPPLPERPPHPSQDGPFGSGEVEAFRILQREEPSAERGEAEADRVEGEGEPNAY